MNYEFVISVTARTLSTAQYQYYSRPLCTTKNELLRAAKSAGLFLTVLFKCTTLCCKVLFQSCYTIESRRLRVCWSDAQSDTPTCRMWPQAHEHHKQTQVPRTAARTATTCDSKFWMMLKSLPNCRRSQSATTCDSSYAPNSTQYYSVLQSITPVLVCTTRYHSSTTKYYSATWKRLWVLMYTTRLNDAPKSLKRRKLKKPWEISNGWH